MSNTKNQYDKERPDDGGPAFPRTGHVHPQDIEPEQWIKGAEGMTLRDYFAAKAMQGMLANASITIEGVDANVRYEGHREWICADAYAMADAMLKAREQ